MSTISTVEVRRNADRWAIFERNPARGRSVIPLASYRRKSQAVLVARFFARWLSDALPIGEAVELVVWKRNGEIGEKNTYGYDPESSKG